MELSLKSISTRHEELSKDYEVGGLLVHVSGVCEGVVFVARCGAGEGEDV